MSTQEVIQCAPWRQPSARPLTGYEWTIVERAIQMGIMSTVGAQSYTLPLAQQLTIAIRSQGMCKKWQETWFSPAPAVAPFAYGCLGSWFAGLDTLSQGRALWDIQFQGLLCRPEVPWAGCPISAKDRSWRPAVKSEYSEQLGNLPPGSAPSDACGFVRRRTIYVPMTGEQALIVFNALFNGQLPPEMATWMQMGGQLFANRSFLIGVQLYQTMQISLPQLATTTDLLSLARAVIEDVVLIWAPNQGASIREMVLSGNVNPTQLMILLQQIMPTAFGDIMAQLPGWIGQQLPTILQQFPPPPGFDLGTILDGIFSKTEQGAPKIQLVQSPSTPPTTGLRVVDAQESAQDPTPPAAIEAASAPGTGAAILLPVAIAAGVALLAILAIRSATA